MKEKNGETWEKTRVKLPFVRLAASHETGPTSRRTGGLCHPILIHYEGRVTIQRFYREYVAY